MGKCGVWTGSHIKVITLLTTVVSVVLFNNHFLQVFGQNSKEQV